MGTHPIVIIGSGAAGLGAVYGLRESDHDVVLLEAASRFGGRLITRVNDTVRVDTAANYISPADGNFEAVLHALGPTGLIDIAEPVYTHSANGTISQGDPDRQDTHKWTYTTGIHTFAHRVLATSNQSIRLGTTVESMHETPTGWDIEHPDGSTILTASHVICTPPAPNTATLLEHSTSTSLALDPIIASIRDVTYRPIITCVLGYDQELDRAYYASVNTDGDHPIGWVSREECKPNHVPKDQCVLVVQMAPWWSAENTDTPDEVVIATATTAVSELLGAEWLQTPSWTMCDQFPNALPNTTPATDPRDIAEPSQLYFAGDWLVGRGRVSEAFLTGTQSATQLQETTH